MAGRGQAKLIDYRVPILSIRQWLKELEQPTILSVVEIYCTAFGACTVILPAINSIMLNIDNSTDKVKWLTVNICKLEDEQKQLLQDEDKKRNDGTSTPYGHGSPAVNYRELNGNLNGVTDIGIDSKPSVHGDELQAPPANTSNISATWDKIYIPKLERYTRYDAPQPLWLFIKDGTILYTLNSPNPPKMHKVITNILSNYPLNESELSSYDFTTATQDELNQRKARKLKQEAEKKAAAIEKAKQAAMQKQVVKPVLTRPPGELLIESVVPFATLKHTFVNKAVIVMYTKEADSIDFVYYNQTEAVHVPAQTDSTASLHWNKAISYTKPPVTDESGKVDVEFKFVLYDTIDEIAKTKDTVNSETSKLVGDGYVHYAQLFPESEDSDEPAKPADIKLVADRHTAHSGENNETVAAHMTVAVKPAISEGTVSTFHVTANVTKPASAEPAEQQPAEPVEGAETVAPTETIVLQVSVSDSNTGSAHAQHATVDMTATATDYNITTPLQIQTYEFVQRSFKFAAVDTTSNTTIAEAVITSADLLKQMQLARTVDLPTSTGYTISLRVWPDGSTPADAIAALPAEQKLSLQFSVSQLFCPLQSKHSNASELLGHHDNQSVVVTLSRQTEDNSTFDMISVTEAATQASHQVFTSNDKINFSTVCIVPKPIGDAAQTYKAAVYLYNTTGAVTPETVQTAVESNEATNVLSTVFTLSNDLLSLSMNHQLPCIDVVGTPMQATTIECNIVDVGSIADFNIGFAATGVEDAYTLALFSRPNSDAEYAPVTAMADDARSVVLTKYSNVHTQYKLTMTKSVEGAVGQSVEFSLHDVVTAANESSEQTKSTQLPLAVEGEGAEQQSITVTLLPMPEPVLPETVAEETTDENADPNSLQLPSHDAEQEEVNTKSSRRATGSRPGSQPGKSPRASGRLITPSKPGSRAVTPSKTKPSSVSSNRRASGRPAQAVAAA